MNLKFNTVSSERARKNEQERFDGNAPPLGLSKTIQLFRLRTSIPPLPLQLPCPTFLYSHLHPYVVTIHDRKPSDKHRYRGRDGDCPIDPEATAHDRRLVPVQRRYGEQGGPEGCR